MSKATLSGEHLDISGEKFGRLTAIERIPVLQANGRKISFWRCQCDCGTEVAVRMHNLRTGNTQSCGCLHREAVERRRKLKSQFPREYIIWSSMKGRCLNPKNSSYEDYGGRGIKVCDRWKDSFEAFFEDVGPRPSPSLQIDRIDNDGNYEPGNVRWATHKEQSRNRRTTIKITIDGETKSLGEWAKQFGLPRGTIEQRIRTLGWDAVRAVTTPKLKSKHDSRAAERVTVVV